MCESESSDSDDPCASPTPATMDAELCQGLGLGLGLLSDTVPQCVWFKVKSITPDAVDPGR